MGAGADAEVVDLRAGAVELAEVGRWAPSLHNVPLRDFAGGQGTDRPQHAGPTEDHPVVAVLGTAGDQPPDWLHGGQALMRLLLAAAADGYAASYLNQPLEQPGRRQQLRDELRLTGWPQLVLRLGRPTGALPPQAPRRPVREILLPAP